MTTHDTDCLDCVDGFSLADVPIMGPSFRTCPRCRQQCACCEGNSYFPSWTRDMVEFGAHFNAQGLFPMLCHNCGGVVGFATVEPKDA